jgi:hypothetical protein
MKNLHPAGIAAVLTLKEEKMNVAALPAGMNVSVTTCFPWFPDSNDP